MSKSSLYSILLISFFKIRGLKLFEGTLRTASHQLGCGELQRVLAAVEVAYLVQQPSLNLIAHSFEKWCPQSESHAERAFVQRWAGRPVFHRMTISDRAVRGAP